MIGDEAEVRAFVGLGGNLGDRLATLRSAVEVLARDLPGTQLRAMSSIYETRPVGPSRRAFFNAVVELRTRSTPLALLELLLAIEQQHGRERRRKWDARTLDLDLLLVQRADETRWTGVEIESEQLRLPHPRMIERDFVLVPLVELTGASMLLGDRTLGEWLARLNTDEKTVLRRLDEGLLDDRAEGGAQDDTSMLGSALQRKTNPEGG
ncbi:MAG: 2-amino-4-hydroxy-6-hydroxymethyldihydropteridine diphosphokinase [Myxococcota bacterium]